MQEADKAIHGKNIIETIVQFIPHQPEEPEKTVESEQEEPIEHTHQPTTMIPSERCPGNLLPP